MSEGFENPSLESSGSCGSELALGRGQKQERPGMYRYSKRHVEEKLANLNQASPKVRG